MQLWDRQLHPPHGGATTRQPKGKGYLRGAGSKVRRGGIQCPVRGYGMEWMHTTGERE